jgi:tetratricopeptide (TPR) repeat protein
MPSILDKLFKRQPAPESRSPPAPEAFDAVYSRAAKAVADRNLHRAIELFDEALALDPSRSEPYYKRANALKDLGRLEEAVAG